MLAKPMAASYRDEKIPREREILPCPCKSNQSYADCCMPYHYGKAKAPTALKLMRSRYSAYYFRRTDYLVETTHPDTREPELEKSIDETIHDITWHYLSIVHSVKGGADDKTGKVEFIAEYHGTDNEVHQLHEISRFRRYKGNWKYLDGKSG